MRTSSLQRELQALGFPLLLVLVGELIVQVLGWHRFWVLLVVLVLGYAARALLRSGRLRVTAPQANDPQSR